MADDYVPGDNYVICDHSGFKIRRSESRKMWNGLIVHKRFWEPRHPLDTIRSKADKQTVPDPRPEASDRFLGANEVTAESL
jgi:hypothetical protein